MLLFVFNGTDAASIQSDIRQMLETALDEVDMNGMMSEEFDHMEVPEFTLPLNAPRLPSQTKQIHKTYDHFKDQGKKAYHCEVAKELVPFFKFLGNYTHRLRLEVKYFGKFAKFTETLGNNAPISDCTKLRRCMQGHLNYHLSSTSLVRNGIDNLDATEVLRNTISNAALTKVTLQEMLYWIKLESGAPLFLQLNQQASGEVDTVIPNTPEAESKALQIKHQVAAWCLNYWADMNPGRKAFYNKLANRAFHQALLHEVSECSWDSITQTVTSPGAQSELAAIAEFEDQDWVKDIINTGTANEGTKKTKAYVDPNIAFPFADDFSVGKIHGANIPKSAPNRHVKKTTAHTVSEKHSALATPVTHGEIIQILDDNEEDDVSVLATKTQDELVALLVKARRAHQANNAGLRAASGSGNLPRSGLVAMPPHTDAGGQKTCLTSNAHDGNADVFVSTEVSSGLGGK